MLTSQSNEPITEVVCETEFLKQKAHVTKLSQSYGNSQEKAIDEEKKTQEIYMFLNNLLQWVS